MKNVSVENLLQWAFCQELCKVGSGGHGMTAVGASNWSITQDMLALGTIIDKSPNSYGVIPGVIEDGDPHPDAVKVGDAVRSLASVGFEVPEGWSPFPDMDDPYGLIAHEVERVVGEVRLKGDRLSGRHLVALVTGASILGHGPDWRCVQPTFRMVSSAGKPRWFLAKTCKDAFGRAYAFETDGYDRKRSKPFRGAYRKYELSEMMRGDVLARLDWQLWRDALGHLANQLQDTLQAHRILPYYAGRAPWDRHTKSATRNQAIENVQ